MTKDLILNLLQTGEQGLIRTFNAVPDDKLNWAPMDAGRTALDAFGDAAQTCQMATALIGSKDEFKPSPQMFAQMKAERAAWTKDDALAAMNTNSAALYTALGTLSDDDLAQSITLPMGGGMTMSLGAWIMVAYRAFISRFAQINYIQTLYGDNEAH